MAEQGGGGATGIVVGLVWGIQPATLVVERDTDSGFGSPTEIAALTTVVASYTDNLSINGTTYYYRAKHTKAGNADSAWSSSVSDTPRDL